MTHATVLPPLDRTRHGRNDFEGFETKRVYALFAKTRAFDDAATHPLVLGVLERLLGKGFQLSAPQAIESALERLTQNLTATTRSIRCPVPTPSSW
jgi:hypothetical protein